MGFRKTLELPNGLVIENAYFRLKTTIIEWEAGIIRIIFGCWTSREASKMGKEELLINGLDISISLPNLGEIDQRYFLYDLVKQYIANSEDHILKGVEDVLEERES